MIQFENVHLSFDNGVVFENLSFSIAPGKHVCIAGPSGSGKSSALKIIQGYLVPGRGNVFINGLPLNKKEVKKIRGKIAYVPQNINLPVDNGKELTGLIGCTANFDIIENYLEQLGLQKEIFYRSFDQISTGQKQRIIIAVCLSLGREILLLDEPTSSLDDELTNSCNKRQAMRPFIQEALIKGLNPLLATMSVMGLISLPGMMTGQILGGASPAVAIKYQVMIMLAIFTGCTLTLVLSILFSKNKLFDDFGNVKSFR